jgi:hypothetical protein
MVVKDFDTLQPAVCHAKALCAGKIQLPDDIPPYRENQFAYRTPLKIVDQSPEMRKDRSPKYFQDFRKRLYISGKLCYYS